MGDRTLMLVVIAHNSTCDGTVHYGGTLNMAVANGFPSHGTLSDVRDGAINMLLRCDNLRALTAVRS